MYKGILGAITGDIIGSRFEFQNRKSKEFQLFAPSCRPTDDSIMTLAVAEALIASGTYVDAVPAYTVRWMQKLGRQYPGAGYGGNFCRWLLYDNPQPYGSWGNGAAMRVSPVGFFAESEDEVRALARAVTAVSHDHPEGILGAEATAMAIFMARCGADKAAIRARIERDYYPINFTLDEIRPRYRFDVSCQGSVPQALEAFFESKDYEDAIRNAISIGGDSDTIACIAGGIASAYFGVPDEIIQQAKTYLDEHQQSILTHWESFLAARNSHKSAT